MYTRDAKETITSNSIQFLLKSISVLKLNDLLIPDMYFKKMLKIGATGLLEKICLPREARACLSIR